MRNENDSFREYILDQLSVGLGSVTCRAMFGGHGLYHADTFFGIVHKSRLYFKTSDSTRVEYENLGMEPFRPSKKQTLKTYYEVPVEVIEDHEELARWAGEAVKVKEFSNK